MGEEDALGERGERTGRLLLGRELAVALTGNGMRRGGAN